MLNLMKVMKYSLSGLKCYLISGREWLFSFSSLFPYSFQGYSFLLFVNLTSYFLPLLKVFDIVEFYFVYSLTEFEKYPGKITNVLKTFKEKIFAHVLKKCNFKWIMNRTVFSKTGENILILLNKWNIHFPNKNKSETLIKF